jgi:hypothetical protein
VGQRCAFLRETLGKSGRIDCIQNLFLPNGLQRAFTRFFGVGSLPFTDRKKPFCDLFLRAALSGHALHFLALPGVCLRARVAASFCHRQESATIFRALSSRVLGRVHGTSDGVKHVVTVRHRKEPEERSTSPGSPPGNRPRELRRFALHICKRRRPDPPRYGRHSNGPSDVFIVFSASQRTAKKGG